jgi:hypothetical protein
MLAILGSMGFICAFFLLNGVYNHKKYQQIIFWICSQGISIFHQIFLSIEIFIIVNHHFKFWISNLTLSSILVLYLFVEILFLTKILDVYQSIERLQAPAARINSVWRTPTVNELLGEPIENGMSDPPIYIISNQTNQIGNNNSSTA